MQIVTMPQASNTMEEGTVVRWLKRQGDAVAQGEILLEIETDKAAVEVESPEAGTLRAILVAEGAMVPIHTPLAILAGADEPIDAALNEAKAKSGQAAPESPSIPESPDVQPAGAPPEARPALATPRTAGGRPNASPAARKIATERGVDLEDLGAGSGPGGRILSTDVPAGAVALDSAFRIPHSAFPPHSALPTAGPGRPLSAMRRAIARNLTLSKQTIPHWYLTVTIDADPLVRLQKAGPGRAPFSLNDIVVAGMARCIMELPAFRGRLEGDRIVDYPAANVGIAVGTEDALVVPVVVGANELSLRQLGATTRRLIESARAGKVQNAGQGQMTISNLGMYGIDEFVAIVNPPETAIVAVGAIREDVIVKDGAMRAGRVMSMTLSADHRVIDGTLGARFMARLRQLLEAPEQLLGTDK